MALFIDTSALLKAYLKEPDADKITELLARPEFEGGLFISEIIELEVLGQLARQIHRSPESGRKWRARRRKYDVAIQEFDRDRGGLNIVPYAPSLARQANELARQHSERRVEWPDLIHIATVEHLGKAVVRDEVLTLVSTDGPLGALSADLGIDHFHLNDDPLEDLLDRQLRPPVPPAPNPSLFGD